MTYVRTRSASVRQALGRCSMKRTRLPRSRAVRGCRGASRSRSARPGTRPTRASAASFRTDTRGLHPARLACLSRVAGRAGDGAARIQYLRGPQDESGGDGAMARRPFRAHGRPAGRRLELSSKMRMSSFDPVHMRSGSVSSNRPAAAITAPPRARLISSNARRWEVLLRSARSRRLAARRHRAAMSTTTSGSSPATTTGHPAGRG